jgi:MFS transporter, DHA2 family, multidrug resistance protein
LMFMMGVMLFSTLVIIPEFLQSLVGYNAELAGSVLSASGVVLLFMMPVVGRLTTKVPAKWLIAIGWISLALSLFYTSYSLDLNISFGEAMWLRVCQVVGIGFLFVPTTMAGYVGVPEEKGNSVSGIVNFMRNIGGSIGTSLVTTVAVRRAQYHQEILVGHVTPDGPAFRNSFHTLSRHAAHFGHSLPDAKRDAIARLYVTVNRQAHTLAYIDAYWVLGVLAVAMFFVALFLKKNDPGAGGQIAAG